MILQSLVFILTVISPVTMAAPQESIWEGVCMPKDNVGECILRHMETIALILFSSLTVCFWTLSTTASYYSNKEVKLRIKHEEELVAE